MVDADTLYHCEVNVIVIKGLPVPGTVPFFLLVGTGSWCLPLDGFESRNVKSYKFITIKFLTTFKSFLCNDICQRLLYVPEAYLTQFSYRC